MAKLKMTHGDTFSFDATIKDNDGPVNLSGGLLIFTVKSKYIDADVAAVAQKKSPSHGIVVTDAPNGKCTVTLSPTDTEGLINAWTQYVWDLQLVSGGNVYTVAQGELEMLPDVTTSVS